jgi:predicted nuclease with TOPRIM domain
MPRFNNADKEKLAALVGEARELRAQTEKLRKKSEALKQQIARVRKQEESRLKNKR